MSTPVAATSDNSIKLWLKMGNIEKLEQAVLNGYGDHLKGKTSRIPKINNFLKQVPHFQGKIDGIHEAVAQGKLREVQSLMDRKKLAMCRTQTGASPLHTAVLSKQEAIAKYIIEKFPAAIQARDNHGRTPLHYAAVTTDGGDMYRMLLESGADKKATDMRGKIPEYYLQNPEELPLKSLRERAAATKIIQRNDRTSRPSELSFATIPSKIEVRMLVQKGDLHKLENIVLNGYGDRLLGETSVNSRVKDFLEIVPDFMVKMATLHSAVIEGSIRDVRNIMDRRTLAIAKDPYGANVLHKAVIHNHHNIVKYLVDNYPETINATDSDGRTPLHYSAAVEDDRIYKTLIGAGADETITDNAGKSAIYYKNNIEQMDINRVVERDKSLIAHTKDSSSTFYSSITPQESPTSKFTSKRDIFQNGPMTSQSIRQWVRAGEVDKLEQIVLEGHGIRLIGETATDTRTRSFLKHVPVYVTKIELLHEAVATGNLREVKTLLDRKLLAKSKDQSGLGLLHKSILYGHPDITRYICEKCPESLRIRDNEGRTPLHYAAVIKDDGFADHLLREAGADPLAVDRKGNPPSYYKEHPEELDFLELQNRVNRVRSKLQTTKKSIPNNRPRIEGGFHVTRANIRKWIHAEDLDKLQQIVFEGHGVKLLVETSNSPKVKEFLKSVPILLTKIRDVHQAAQDGNLKELEEKVDNKQLYLSKDFGGFTPLHRATIMVHRDVCQYIVEQCPDSVKAKDDEGRTALHYAAALPRDEGFIYNMLVEAGGDSKQTDDRGRSPEYYQKHPADAEIKSVVIRLLRKPPELNIPATVVRRQHQPPQTLKINKNKAASSYVALSPEHVAKLINQGDVEKLEQLVLEGHGKKLYGKTSWIEDVRTFLRRVPTYMDRIYAVHRAVANGDLHSVEELMDNKKLVIAKDDKGLTPLHRAIKYGKNDIVKYMVQMYPAAANVKDREGRTPLHYAGMYKDRDELYKVLVQFGADTTLTDNKGKTPEDYERSNMKLEVMTPQRSAPEEREEESEAKDEEPSIEESEDEKNIAQWIADGDIANLEQLIIDGKGDLLLGKTSDNEPMQDFLEAVPASMGKIRAIHNAAAEGNQRELQVLLDKRAFATARDSFKACPLHRALIHGHTDVIRYLANNYPATLNIQDMDGRTPLHYAAMAGDGGLYYRLLHKYGADPNIKDKNGSTPGHYLRGRGEPLSLDKLVKRYEEKKVPPRPPSVQTWERPPTAEILKALTPSPLPGENDDDFPIAAIQENEEDGELTVAAMGEAADEGESEVELPVTETPAESGEAEDAEATEPAPETEPVPEDDATEATELEPEDGTEPAEPAPDEVEAEDPEPAEAEDPEPAEAEEPEPVEEAAGEEAEAVEEAAGEEEEAVEEDAGEEVVDVEEAAAEEAEAVEEAAGEEAEAVEEAAGEEAAAEEGEAVEEAAGEEAEAVEEAAAEEGEAVEEAAGEEAEAVEEAAGEEAEAVVEAATEEAEAVEEAAAEVTEPAEEAEAEPAEPAEEGEVEAEEPAEEGEVEAEEPAEEGEVEAEEPAEEETEAAEPIEEGEVEAEEPAEGVTEAVEPAEEGETESAEPAEEGEIEAAEPEAENENVELAEDSAEAEPTLEEGEPEADEPDVEGEAENAVPETAAVEAETDEAAVVTLEDNEPEASEDAQESKETNEEGPTAETEGEEAGDETEENEKNNDDDDPAAGAGAANEAADEENAEDANEGNSDTKNDENQSQKEPTQPENTETNEEPIEVQPMEVADESSIQLEEATEKPLTPPLNGLRTATTMSRNNSRLSSASQNPIMWTKEGEYLAAVMGDALIKALTEVSQKRPEDPIGFLAIWLYQYAMESLDRATSPNFEKEVDENDPLMNSTGLKREEMEKGLYEARLAKSSGHRSSEDSRCDSPTVTNVAKFKDETGKTLLHFAAKKPHEGNALWLLLLYSNCNPSEKDNEYNTARDIAENAGLKENVAAIDKYVGLLVATDKFERVRELMINFYEHIIDTEDAVTHGDIIASVETRGQGEMFDLLNRIKPFQENVVTLHETIAAGDADKVRELINPELAAAKSVYARCSLHEAVLHSNTELVEFIASSFPDTVKIKDNMKRTALHYAMGLENSHEIAKILIQYGASRQSRDVKSRTPSYYFVEPEEITLLENIHRTAIEVQ